MMNKTRNINLNQLMTLMILFLIGGSALASTGRYSGQDVWIVILVGGAIGALLFTMYLRISKLHDYKEFPTILKSCFGKYLGICLTFIYAGFFLFRTFSIGNFMSTMAQQTLMYGASTRLVITLLLATVIFASIHGLTSISRSSEIFFIIIIICLLPFLMSVFTNGTFKTANLVPVLAEGFPRIGQDISRIVFFPFGELVVFLMIFPYMKKSENKQILKRGYIAISIAVLLMIAIDLTTVALIGASLTSSFEYSFFNAMQLAGMNGLLERLDPLAVVIMVVSEYFKLVLFFFSTLLAIQALNKKFEFKYILILISFIIFIFAPLVNFEQLDFLLETMPFKILPIFELVIPVIILIISEIKHRKQKKSAHTEQLT